MEHDIDQFNRAVAARINRENVEYWKSNQKNFSEEANLIIKKAEEGEKLSELDVFIITCESQEKVEQYKRFYKIRKSVKEGNIKKDDLHFLINTLCGEDKNMSDQMKSSFEYLFSEKDK